MKEIFKQLIFDSQEKEYKGIVEREYAIPTDTRKIVSLIGVRRSGKTFLLYQLIRQLRGNGVNRQNIFYINFEDDRLYPLNLSDMDALVEAYYELYPDKRGETCYWFLDEVQNIQGWERFIRRIYDTLDLRIFVTGSSSKLLSSEIASSLRGRTIVYEIFPFSFREYLTYRGIEVNLHSSKSLSFIRNAFNTYLINGGFAETFDVNEDIRLRILRDYLDLVLYRDVVERYNVKNHALLKHLIKHLIVNMGTLVSFTKLYNDYKSMGFKVSKDTLFEYLSYLEEAYALFTVPIHRNSVRAEQRHPKKIYAVDNGFKKLFDASLSPDYSKLYENLAFLHLRRQTREIYYYKGKQEVDLYADIGNGYLLNVSYSIDDPKTLRRELEGLEEAMAYFQMDRAFLLTSKREEILETEAGRIELLPLWKRLLM